LPSDEPVTANRFGEGLRPARDADIDLVGPDLVTLAHDTARDACINETLAVLEAALELRLSREPAVRAVLARGCQM